MPGVPLLTIAYSTTAHRADDVSLADIDPEFEVLVCVQGGCPADTSRLERARIVPVPGLGVARSRNAAIDQASGKYLLFCDDDVAVNLAGVIEGVRYLQATGHALALGRGVDPSGSCRKRYPLSVTRLTLFNSGKAATYEMLIDRMQVCAKGVRFDIRFGAGTDMHLGDEYIFIADLLRAGLSGVALPAVYGTHPQASSGLRWGTPQDFHARAMAINRVFGPWAIWARTAFALKHHDRFGTWQAFVAFITNGARPPASAPEDSNRAARPGWPDHPGPRRSPRPTSG